MGAANEELCCDMPLVERAMVEVGVSANTPFCNETVNQQLPEETRLQVTDGMQPEEASNIVVQVQDCQVSSVDVSRVQPLNCWQHSLPDTMCSA
jgi:hypothetical protein